MIPDYILKKLGPLSRSSIDPQGRSEELRWYIEEIKDMANYPAWAVKDSWCQDHLEAIVHSRESAVRLIDSFVKEYQRTNG